MPSEYRDYLELSYGELEELNLAAKEQRKQRVALDVIQEERLRYLTDEKRHRVERYFARYGQGLVMVARFLPGLRVVTYFTAGATSMGPWTFLLFDFLAASISAPIWIFTGRRIGHHLDTALGWVARAHWIFMGLAAIIGLIGLFVIMRRNGSASEKSPKSKADDLPTPGAAAPVPPVAAPAPERTGSAG